MGSFNPYPVSEKDPGKNQQQDIQQELNAEEKLVISMLINSVLYFIECVFIIRTKDKFRLVALHHSRVLYDKFYPTERGCKIAFSKLFKEKGWKEEVNAYWSHFYDPDTTYSVHLFHGQGVHGLPPGIDCYFYLYNHLSFSHFPGWEFFTLPQYLLLSF